MNRTINLLASAAIALLLAACTAETDGSQSGSETGNVLKDVSITLTPEVPQEVETRAVEEKNGIEYVYLFQYNADGTAPLQEPQEFVVTPQAFDSYVLKGATLVNQPSIIYLLVNSFLGMDDISNFDISSAAGLKAAFYYINDESYLMADRDCPSMTGLYIGVPQPKMNIPLVRSISRVNFNLSASLPAGHSFTLSSVQVKQVPDRRYYLRSDHAIPYPTLAAGETIDYDATTYPNQDLATTPVSILWYLPENCRGTGTATSELDKNAETAPAGQAAYCTYVEIKGKYDSGANWVGKLDVTYRIYLGGNNTNDYNLRYNTNYTVNTVLKGANRADTRITVTGTENAATYLDYTDNFSPWMVAATADANSNTKYSLWMIGTGPGADGSQCPAGWRMPTLEELMLIYVYNSSVAGISDRYYVTNSLYSRFTFIDGTGDVNSIDPVGCVRCVRDI